VIVEVVLYFQPQVGHLNPVGHLDVYASLFAPEIHPGGVLGILEVTHDYEFIDVEGLGDRHTVGPEVGQRW
jgi:hypothetical protein